MSYEDELLKEVFGKLNEYSNDKEKYINEMANKVVLLVIERRKSKKEEIDNEKIKSILKYTRWLLKQLYDDYVSRSQSKNSIIEDIEYIGSGYKSIALRVGDNVLKLGKHDYKYTGKQLDTKYQIPTYIKDRYEIGEKIYLEVQVAPYVDIKNITLENVYETYSNIRDLGYIWNDPKEDNMGRIINVGGCKIGDKTYLPKHQYNKGDIVILDLEDIAYVGEETSDLILDEISMMSYNRNVYNFETRKMEEKSQQKIMRKSWA